MTKGDFPALRMTIEGGRLVPAGQFDAERLNSYRRGTVVFVRFTEEKDRVLIRKWWAILGLVLKQCETPWKNKDEASEAIKLALGIVNLSKTVGGQFMQYPKSLTEIEDPEMAEALENMTALLSTMTGVDVETLKKETAHIGAEPEPDQPDSGDVPSSPDNADDPATASSAAADETSDPPPAGSSAATLSAKDRAALIECGRKFLALTTRTDLDTVGKRSALEMSKDDWKETIRPELHQKLASLFISTDAIIRGKAAREAVILEFSNWLECEPEELETSNG